MFFPLICGLGFNFCSFVWFKIKQGGWLSMQVPAQRRGLHETLISLETSSDVPAILFLWWEEAQPKNLHVDFLFFFKSLQTKTKSFSFMSVPVRFSQSELLPTSSDGTVTSSKDVERFPSQGLSLRIIKPFLSGLTGVFFARTMHSTSVIR